MGRLTTHVLDTALGRPAAGLEIELWQRGEAPRRLKTVTTDADGRAGEPLLEGAAMTPGVYELCFFVGDYLRGRGIELPEPAFLEVVPVRFGIAEPDGHYHVPLLVSPFGYSTYRGS